MLLRITVCVLLAAACVIAWAPFASEVSAGARTPVDAATTDTSSPAPGSTAAQTPLGGMAPGGASEPADTKPELSAAAAPTPSTNAAPVDVIVAPVKRVMPKAVTVKPEPAKPVVKAASSPKDEKAASISVKPKPKKISENDKKGRKVSRN